MGKHYSFEYAFALQNIGLEFSKEYGDLSYLLIKEMIPAIKQFPIIDRSKDIMVKDVEEKLEAFRNLYLYPNALTMFKGSWESWNYQNYLIASLPCFNRYSKYAIWLHTFNNDLSLDDNVKIISDILTNSFSSFDLPIIFRLETACHTIRPAYSTKRCTYMTTGEHTLVQRDYDRVVWGSPDIYKDEVLINVATPPQAIERKAA